MGNKSVSAYRIWIPVKNYQVPLTISFERRPNARISAASRCVYLRLPNTAHSRNDLNRHLDWVKSWLSDLHDRKPGFLTKYQPKVYEDGDILTLCEKDYTINIQPGEKKTPLIKFQDSKIVIAHPGNQAGDHSTADVIRKTLIKGISKHFKSILQARVHQINDQHLNLPVRDVKIRYARTRWGSCSHDGIITLSTRLCLLESKYLDYIIKHELAHLAEFNHSARFWNLVNQQDVDYRNKERWLNKYGHLYDF